MSRPLLVIALLVPTSTIGCDGTPISAEPETLEAFGWTLRAAVSVRDSDILVELHATNQHPAPAVPPIYNEACAVDLRVYDSEIGDRLLYDGITARGCLDIGYETPVDPGAVVRFSRSVQIAELVAAGLSPGADYRMISVARSFGELRGLEVPDPKIVRLP